MSNSSDRQRRVVVTGMGAITPLGCTLTDFEQSLAEARSGISNAPEELDMAFAGLATSFTGSIDDFGELPKDRKKAIRKALKLMCRETQMAVAAAQQALAHAGHDEESRDPERSGIVLGSDYMLTMPEDYADAITKCAGDADFDYTRWGGDGLGEMTPLWMLKYLPNMPASHIAIFNDLRGPNNSLTMREASSMMAIGEAFRTVARGHADVMLCGATGTRVLPMQAIHAKQSEQLASGDDPHTASRPFDRSRTGMVAGEGAAVLVLEELAVARARGATIHGEIVGHGSSLVAGEQLTGRNQLALSNAMRATLADADLKPSDVGHINAHGLATPDADAEEAAAIADVFGEHSAAVPVFAPKSYFGNLGAGSGAAELIASLSAFAATALPPTLNFEQADEGTTLRVAGTPGTATGEVCLKTSVTPQGQAAAIALKSPSSI